MNHKVLCWCGINTNPKRLHYPSNDPENGPAHHPKSPCLTCGSQPHSGPCFPNCTCGVPSPQYHQGDNDGILLCTTCGNEIYFPDQDPQDLEAETGEGYINWEAEQACSPEAEAYTCYLPLSIPSESVPLHLIRTNGHSNIGSALAVGIEKWLNEQEDK